MPGDARPHHEQLRLRPRDARIAENFDVFDFELSGEDVAAMDALDTGVRGGPEPDSITLEHYGIEIPEA